ncbi:unnamed protein product [Heterobilharzia americana]|nr:unnamed protein product [Heterobilharzia americana]
MPPKQSSKSETALVRSMSELLKDYEHRADHYETTVCNSIKKSFRKALEEDRPVTRFLVDPQDRRLVEYWDDNKLIDALKEDTDDSISVRKKKVRNKPLKEDKPLVKLLPLIEAIRAKRYTLIKELFVWDCHIENDDMIALTGLFNKGCYLLTRVELIDCFLDAKSIGTLMANIASCKTLRDLCLDFNDLGEQGCRALCNGLAKSCYLIHLSLSFCGLTKQCGLWLGNLVAETAIRELILDGNNLEAEGTIALLSLLSDAADREGFERNEAIGKKQLFQEESKKRNRVNLDALPPLNEGLDDDTELALQPPPPLSPLSSKTNSAKKSKKKKSSKVGKRGKKGKNKFSLPAVGPQISVLKLADNGINHYGRGGNFATVRCMQLLKRQILEGILFRKDAKLPQIGVRLGHRINQDTFDMVHKLAPGPKKRKRKGKKGK